MRQTAIWVFAVHNVRSCVVIFRAGVGDTQDLLLGNRQYLGREFGHGLVVYRGG
jgi:hypothetical protein